MIEATVFKDSKQGYTGINIAGHAEYADSGFDIICAAVSALSINFYNSVETFTTDGFKGAMEETGHFTFRFTDTISSESQLLIRSLILGLQNIEKEYGKQYIRIRFKEV